MEPAGVIRALAVAGALLLAAAAAGCGGTKTVTVTETQTTTRTVTSPQATGTGAGAADSPCAGSALSGTFKVVPGSAGAGQISYVLTLTNTSQSGCYVTGIPVVQLLDASGSQLPTQVSPARPGVATSAKISLAPGAAADAEARFSPDVPGQGDQQSGRCQPTASTLQVTATGGGTVNAPIDPPTSVCEQGSLSFDVLSTGR
ncbi:MAG TPA: DUF4232 domain-containing protein [Gaiellaceae bacterium]|nr:DUF4232 domain-containing protein [Gaiellaceae bacterium]